MSETDTIIALDIPGLTPGLKMRVHNAGDRMVSATLRREHIWEPYETYLTLQYLEPGDVYVDVGANIGYYSLVAAQRVGADGKVFAYEPDPDNFALLESNIDLNNFTQVQAFPFALHDRDSDGHLFLSGDNFGDHRIYGSTRSRTSRKITLVHGGNHLGKLTRHIDFLKIDTQGAEYFVMNGLKELIRQNRRHIHIMLEFCPWGIRQSGADGHALVQLIDELEMQLQIVDHQQECLIPAETRHLRDWVTDMLKEPDNEGFVNLLLTPNI